jgi:energy-coupling factor transport system ATP-binding protein
VIRLEGALVLAGGDVRGGVARGGDAPAGARRILGPLDWTVGPGERHLVLGANGSGKTTLLQVLSGLRPFDGGRRFFRDVETPSRGDTRGHWPEIGLLLEEPDPQLLTERVDAEVAFGLEGLALDESETARRVEEALGRLDLTHLRARDPRELSGGEKARVLLAAALAARPRCLLLDQTLTHLDPGTRRAIEAEILEIAAERGMAVVHTRQEAEAPGAGEQVWVLEDGIATEVRALEPQDVARLSRVPFPAATRVAAALAAAGCWRGPLAVTTDALESGWTEPAPGAEIGDIQASLRRFGVRMASDSPARPVLGPVRLEMRGVAWSPRPRRSGEPVLAGLDLEARGGEIVSLVGASGCGKTSILRLAAGLDDPDAGIVKRPAGRRPVSLAMEYPERSLFGRTVSEDVAVSLWIVGAPLEARGVAARAALETVGLDPDRFENRIPATLSEGEKRRAAIASLLVDPPQIIALDEPTAGLDPEGKRMVEEALLNLRAEGRAVLLASHDLDFVSRVSDRVALLARERGAAGRVVAEGAPQEVWSRADVLGRARIPEPDHVRLDRFVARVLHAVGASRSDDRRLKAAS